MFRGLVWQEYYEKWLEFYESFITYNGYREVLKGLLNTLLIAVSGLAIGIIVGTLLAFAQIVPVKNAFSRLLKRLAGIYVAFFRGTPIVVQLLLTYYVLLPALGIRVPQIAVGIIAFGLNSGAYVSEMMRGGILSVDAGQTEAGRSLGLTYRQTMLYIVLPQAVKNIIPMLGNELIALVKETSVVSFIAIVDVTRALQSIGASNYEFVIPYIVLALIYLTVVMVFTFIVRKIERRLRRSDKR